MERDDAVDVMWLYELRRSLSGNVRGYLLFAVEENVSWNVPLIEIVSVLR
jgi:hypothetical protein